MKASLTTTVYGEFLKNDDTITTSLISEKCMEFLVAEFYEMKADAMEPLTTFFDYIQ